MIEYSLVRDNSLGYLETKVNKKIKEGWSPQGGIAMTTVGQSVMQNGQKLFCQTMIRTKDTK